jgi:hypothetical protein
MALKRESPEAKLASRRAVQLEQLNQRITALVERVATLKQKQRDHDLLESVSLGLYEELDKLSKKAGVDQVTHLLLEQVNDFTRDAKRLMAEDTYVQKYKEFVPAGDNPENRDALLLIRQIRQGLNRFNDELVASTEKVTESLNEAQGVRIAVKLFLQGIEDVVKGHFEANEVSVAHRWMRGHPTSKFAFDLLDRTDIPSYFSGADEPAN